MEHPKPQSAYSLFYKPMDPAAVRERLNSHNDVYELAVAAAGHQNAFTVDKLSWKLKAVLPALIAGFAEEIESEYGHEPRRRPDGDS